MERQIHKRKVIVKNISSKCSDFTLQYFLEVVFNAEVDKIEYYKNNRETAVVSFSDDIEDFNKSCQSPKAKKPLEGSEMQLLPVLLVDGIILENIQPNFTEDMLTFYFENKKSGGRYDGVKNCSIYSKLKLAVVQFVDSEIASSVLHINSHTIAGKSITIKPFIEAFHKETLDKLSKDKERAVDSESCGLNVLAIKQNVEQELVINSNDAELFKLIGTKARCFQKLYLKDITDLKDVIRRSNGEYKEIKANDEAYIISISGEQTKVRYVLSELDKLAKQIWHETIILHKDVAKPKDLEILIRGLQRSDLKKFQATFEVQHSCCLTIHLPNTSSYKSVRTTNFMVFPEEEGLASGDNTSIQIGSTTIQVLQGDITKHKASVLVKVITEDHDLRKTALSQAFLRSGGASLNQAFQQVTSYGEVKKIYVTKDYDLNCDYVYHVVVKKFDNSDAESSRQGLIAAVEDCFKVAQTYNTKSIALPAIGTGVLFKFSPSFVATCLVSAAKDAAQNSTSLKNISFVISDQDIYFIFVKELASALPETSQTYCKCIWNQEERIPSERAQTSKITIEAKTQDTCMRAKKALIKDLQSSFLHTEFVENDGITKLPSGRCSELAKMADENGVYIKFPNAEKIKSHRKIQLKLKGEKDAVTAIKMRVQDILLNEMSKERKENTRKSVKPGTAEFIKMMATTSDHNTPKYWTYFTPNTKVSKLLSSRFGTTNKDWSLQDIPANEDIYKAISDLVAKTWKQNLVGQGKDALNLTTGHKLKIVKIERLENIELFRRYCQNRARLFVKAAKKPITPIRKLRGSKVEVETTAAAAPSLRQDIYVNEINEHYLFHGTKMDTIKVICENGLDSPVSNINAMFGSGIYAAESSTKADQYADDKYNRQPNGTDLCMILLRMALGEPFLTNNKNSPKYRLPPCKGSGCHKDGCRAHTETFDSVIGDGSWHFRKFVVYERHLVYPEYFITYQRV